MNSLLIVCLALGIAAVSCGGGAIEDSVVFEESKIETDGNFHSRYETGAGTKIMQDGHLKHVGNNDSEVVTGEILFTGTDGKNYDLTYVADENGYQPKADFLPTPPPIPEAIQRALDYIASHQSAQSSKKN